MSDHASNRHILVIEDDPNVRGLLQTLFSSEGYSVETASDGIAGLVKASHKLPALVVLDVMMPDLGGFRVLDELGADPVFKATPIVVVTGKLEAVSELRERLGADSVFTKPFEVEELLARVGQLMGHSDA